MDEFVERVNFQFIAITGAGIDVPDAMLGLDVANAGPIADTPRNIARGLGRNADATDLILSFPQPLKDRVPL